MTLGVGCHASKKNPSRPSLGTGKSRAPSAGSTPASKPAAPPWSRRRGPWSSRRGRARPRAQPCRAMARPPGLSPPPTCRGHAVQVSPSWLRLRRSRSLRHGPAQPTGPEQWHRHCLLRRRRRTWLTRMMPWHRDPAGDSPYRGRPRRPLCRRPATSCRPPSPPPVGTVASSMASRRGNLDDGCCLRSLPPSAAARSPTSSSRCSGAAPRRPPTSASPWAAAAGGAARCPHS